MVVIACLTRMVAGFTLTDAYSMKGLPNSLALHLFLTNKITAYVTQVMDPLYLRMRALYRIAVEEAYRKEVVGGALGQRLIDGKLFIRFVRSSLVILLMIY
jgi:hypothetical protein